MDAHPLDSPRGGARPPLTPAPRWAPPGGGLPSRWEGFAGVGLRARWAHVPSSCRLSCGPLRPGCGGQSWSTVWTWRRPWAGWRQQSRGEAGRAISTRQQTPLRPGVGGQLLPEATQVELACGSQRQTARAEGAEGGAEGRGGQGPALHGLGPGGSPWLSLPAGPQCPRRLVLRRVLQPGGLSWPGPSAGPAPPRCPWCCPGPHPSCFRPDPHPRTL